LKLSLKLTRPVVRPVAVPMHQTAGQPARLPICRIRGMIGVRLARRTMADDPSEQLLGVIDTLDELAGSCTPEEAAEQLDPVVLQAFWRDWPHTSVWAGNLWRTLNRDLEAPASERLDRDVDEVGGSG